MKILLVHNYTQNYARGGEAHVFEDELELLRSHGHEVDTLTCANAQAMNASKRKKLSYFLVSSWSTYGYYLISNKIKDFDPDIIHVHNFFFILSPKIFKAAYDFNVPVVVTLHNHRYVVPCSQMIRDGKLCTVCLGKNPWRILIYRCYKNSFMASLFRYRFYYSSQKKYNWWRYIDTFIALTSVQKATLVQGGLPENRISVKGNCVSKPDAVLVGSKSCSGAVFAGRLDIEKGVRTLIEAWRTISYPLTVVGDGPLADEVRLAMEENPNIIYIPHINRAELMRIFSKSSFIVVPSVYYEPFGLVNLEAMSLGKPILASNIGAMSVLIEHGVTGLLFTPGDADDLARRAAELIDDISLCRKMGENARELYLSEYTPERNYERLIAIYNKTISEHSVEIERKEEN